MTSDNNHNQPALSGADKTAVNHVKKRDGKLPPLVYERVEVVSERFDLDKMPEYKTIFSGEIIKADQVNLSDDWSDKKVGVIGITPVTARHIPKLISQAKHVKLFLADKVWVLPSNHLARVLNDIVAFDIPVIGGVSQSVSVRMARCHLNNQVLDSWLRRQLRPDPEDKLRWVMSDELYPALQQKNAKVITWPLVGFDAKGLKTAEGLIHQLDTIIYP